MLSAAIGTGLAFVTYLLLDGAWELLLDQGLPGADLLRSWWALTLARVLLAAFALLLSIALYRTIAGLAILPFLGPLLEAVEQRTRGEVVQLRAGVEIQNAMRGAFAAVQMGLAGLLVLVLGLCTGPLEVPINILWQGYSLGRGSFDPVFEKAAPARAERRLLIRRYRWEIVGIGLAFLLALLLPLAGPFVAPAAGLVGAALLFEER